MKPLDRFEVWLITGSQHIYGEAALEQVAEQSRRSPARWTPRTAIPVRVVAQARQ